jgi:hypothetical protein
MKTFARIVTTILGFTALAIGAKAQDPDRLVIHIPYEFVITGTTLPAGTYAVSRVETSNEDELIVRNLDNEGGVLVVPSIIEDAHGDSLGFTFQTVGGEHFLTKIETAEHVLTVSVSKSAILEATNKSRQSSKGLRATAD